MSLILEALRKSEAERRRGQSPGLHVELPPVAPRDARALRMRAWAAVGVLALAAVAMLALWQWRTTVLPRDTATTRTATRGVSTQASAPAATPTHIARTPEPVAPAVAPAAVPVDARVDARSQPAPNVAPPVAPTAPARDTAMATPPPSPMPPQSTPQPASVAELDQLGSARTALPAMTLTMHVWDRDPARRFAILDGRRVREGDAIGEATVREIAPDGVLLDWNGRIVRIPLR